MHAGLGGGVVGLAVLALLAVDRTDLDDPAPLAFAHAFDHRAGDVEHRVEVGVDDLLPLLRAHLVEGAVAGDAGVVDQDVDRAELLPDLAHHRHGVLGRGTVPLGKRSAEHTSELQALMRNSYSVLCLSKHNTHISNSYAVFTLHKN